MKKLIITFFVVIIIMVGFYFVYYYFLYPKNEPVASEPNVSVQVTSNPSLEGVLYKSHFSSNNEIKDWGFADDGDKDGPSHWFIRNNALVQDSNIFGGTYGAPIIDKSYLGTQAVLKKGSSWSDYFVTVKFRPQDNDGIGFLLRYQNQDNYYRVLTVLDTTADNGGPFIKIDRMVNGQVKGLFQKRISYKVAEDNEIKIRVKGNRIEVWLNDDKSGKIWAEDKEAQFKTGRFGFSTFAEQGVEFKDLLIEDLNK